MFTIIDGHGWFYRAYYGSLKTANGEPDHALTTFRAMLKDYVDKYKPDQLVVARDAGRESFRHEIFPNYKSNRKAVPDGIAEQLSRFPAYLDSLGVPHLGCPNFEADDIAGTLCSRFSDTYQIYLATGDKDWLQLVNDRVSVINSKNELMAPTDVAVKFGVIPEQVVEVLALMGDATDGIPGVAGIGEKIAVALIQGWLNLEHLYDHLGEVETSIKSGPRIHGLLEVGREAAFLSRELVTINRKAPVYAMGDFEWRAQL
jgi:DNA polymerase-1